MRRMSTEYCKALENEVEYLLRSAAHTPTRQEILVLLRDRATHWRNQRVLAGRRGTPTDE